MEEMINYTDLMGEKLLELGFSKQEYSTRDSRFKYKKEYDFGYLSITDGSKDTREHQAYLSVVNCHNEELKYIHDKPKNVKELVELISKLSCEYGIDRGKCEKMYDIRKVLGLEED